MFGGYGVQDEGCEGLAEGKPPLQPRAWDVGFAAPKAD